MGNRITICTRSLCALLLSGTALSLEQAQAANQSQQIAANGETERVVITGNMFSYTPPQTPTATKTNTPLIQTPQSVQVISRQVLDDQAVLNLQDATRNVAGVQAAFGFEGTNNACVRVRGFSTEQGSVGCTYYIDGVRTWAQPMPFAALQAVEVVKGPNTVLFGRNEPGGMVNIVTKSPTPDRVVQARAWGGSFNTRGTAVDLGGALNDSKTLSGRLNAAYTYTDTFRRGAFDQLINVNLGLGWQPDAATNVVFKFDYNQNTYSPDFGLPALGNQPAPVSIRQSYKQDYIDSRTTAYMARLIVDRRLGDTWNLRVSGFGSYQTPNYFNVYGYGLNETTLQLPVYYFAEQFSWRRTWQGNADLTGEAQALGMTHQLLFGADYNDERYDGPIWYDGVAPDLDLFNPMLGTAPRYYPTRAEYQPWGSVQRWIGLYAQDQVHINDKIIVNFGGRFDRAKGAFSPSPITDAVSETAFKPRVGAVYMVAPNLSTYVQYQEAFGPNNGRSSAGTGFRGQTATQTEIGIKWQSEDGAFLASLAAFDLRKQRLLTADLSTPDPLDRIAVGEVRNRGIEVDVSGRVTEKLSLIGSYSYSDAVTTKDDSGFQDKRYQGVPRHAGSIWVRYQATDALALGGGLFTEATRPGDLGNTFVLPGYGRVDAFVQYAFSVNDIRWTAQLNVNNIFDQRYFTGVYNNSRDFILPGSPRAAMFTLRAAM